MNRTHWMRGIVAPLVVAASLLSTGQAGADTLATPNQDTLVQMHGPACVDDLACIEVRFFNDGQGGRVELRAMIPGTNVSGTINANACQLLASNVGALAPKLIGGRDWSTIDAEMSQNNPSTLAIVMHARDGNGQPVKQHLTVMFGELDTGTKTGPGGTADVSDASFRCSLPQAAPAPGQPGQPAPQPSQPSPGGTSCDANQPLPPTRDSLSQTPQSGNELQNGIGGLAQFWSVISGSGNTGWKYEGEAACLIAPPTGKLDTPDGVKRNGEQSFTTVATYWSRG